MFDDPTAGIPAVPELLENGWVLVAPDYVGMETEGDAPYLICTVQAYSSLDALRAANQLLDVSLADQAVVWGHSQGGHAALWTGLLADDYAPDLVIEGVAALAPASIRSILRNCPPTTLPLSISERPHQWHTGPRYAGWRAHSADWFQLAFHSPPIKYAGVSISPIRIEAQ